MRLLFLAVSAFGLASCQHAAESSSASDVTTNQTPVPAASAAVDYSDKGKQAAWIEKGESAIKAKLRDPDSAQFRDVEFHSGGGIAIVCGEVNANNGFGGKAGYERFVAAGDVVDVLESEMKSSAEMDPVWQKFCRG